MNYNSYDSHWDKDSRITHLIPSMSLQLAKKNRWEVGEDLKLRRDETRKYIVFTFKFLKYIFELNYDLEQPSIPKKVFRLGEDIHECNIDNNITKQTFLFPPVYDIK